MKLFRIVLAIVCCFVLMELALGLVAVRSKAKALQMLQTMDSFKLGTTSRTEADSELRQLGLIPQDEACSASTGPCKGIGVELANYPESSQRAVASVLEFVARRISAFRPTYVVANFYFHSDRLAVAEVQFSTDKASIGTMLASTDSGEHETTEWRRNNRTGNETYVRVLDPAQEEGALLRSADIFDLGCMDSIRGCNTALRLWPSSPRYRASQ
jgi:hypothetical protein